LPDLKNENFSPGTTNAGIIFKKGTQMKTASFDGPENGRTNGQILGRAVFIRTDRADFGEEEVPFDTMDEMFRLCLESQRNLSLQKIVLSKEVDRKPCTVTLEYTSTSSGRPVKPKIKNS
jgi:hypothetical protein